jgi:hypothetical protein
MVPVIIVFIMAPFGASIGRRFPFADFDAGQARIESSLRRWKRSSAALSATDVHLDANFTTHCIDVRLRALVPPMRGVAQKSLKAEPDSE